MTVTVDAAGNLRGLLAGSSTTRGRLVIGSHLDTVPNAGAFDGVLGVVLGVAIAEELQAGPLPFALEVVGFSEEEGVRFGRPFLGSLAFAGKFDDGLLELRDAEDLTVRDVIEGFGLDSSRIEEAAMSADTFAYLEFHIEQGPVLESMDKSLGVVEGIVGQSRLELVFTGRSNHAGTTPMHLRQDALAAAAEWIIAVERYASEHSAVIATVGRIDATPGVGNVIAGEVKASLDVRAADDAMRREAVRALLAAAREAGARRGVIVNESVQMEQEAIPMDRHLAGQLLAAAKLAGFDAHRMQSGAGHDAMVLAPVVPATMLFLRTPGGLSHHPEETVRPEDVEAALRTGVGFARMLADDKTIGEAR